MDSSTITATWNADSKSRAGLGPRLKSYLSSGNLFGSGHGIDFELKTDDEATWPDLDPVFDETTITCNTKLDRWISALRHRIWMHGDVPLGTKYNAPLLWMIEQCIKVSKENKRLKEELQQMSTINQELLRTRLRPSNSLHRPSNSVPDAIPPAWVDSQNHATPKHRSISFSDQSMLHTAKTLVQYDAETTVFSSQEPPEAVLEEPGSDEETAKMTDISSRELNDISFNEGDQSANYQLTSPSVEPWPSDGTAKNHDISNNEGVQGSITRSELSSGESFRHSISYQNLPSTTSLEEMQAVDHRRRKSSASVHLSRRVFSFCPGEDDVLCSLAEYSRHQQEQRQLTEKLDALPVTWPVQGSQHIRNVEDIIHRDRSASLAREGSESSVVTVVKARKQKKGRAKTAADKATASPVPDNTRNIKQRDTSADKAHGPLAAALAATARFGKNAKKTIRTVPPDL